MKAYRPKLQAVLTLRQHAEQAALENYARALLQRRQAVANLDAVERDLSRAWIDLRRLLDGASAACEISSARGYVSTVEEKVRRAQALVDQSERAVNQTQQKLLSARHQREAIEKFQSRHKLRFEREAQRLEQKWLDDLAGRRNAPLALSPFPTESSAI